MKKDLFSGYSYGISGESVPKKQTNRNFFRSCFNLRYVLLIAIVACFSGTFAQTVLINPATDGGFEQGSTFAANGWTEVNDATNKWVLGGVPAWQTGTNSAYVSNNTGTNWAYTSSGAQRSFFYKDVVFPAGETNITLNFDWRGNGNDTDYDNLLVYVAATTVTPSNVGPVGTNTATTGWTGYTNGTTGYYLLQRNGTTNPTTTTNVNYTFSAAQGTFCAGNTRRLIFVWKNDGSGGTNPPASVDNISLTSSCQGPTATAATLTTFDSFQANWNAFTGATGYTLEYRATGDVAWTSYTGNPVAGTSAVISGLNTGTTYQFRVSATGPVCTVPSNILTATPTCSILTGVTVPAGTMTSSGATINWTAPGAAPANGYEYEIRTSGAAGSGATGLVASGTTLAGVVTATVSTLTSATAYTVYVRSSCSATVFSNWTTGVAFTTLCNAEAIPTVSQGFEVPTIPVCWTSALITGSTAWTSDNTNDAVPAPHSGTTFMGKDYTTSDAIIASQPINFTTAAATGSRMNVWIYRSSSNIPGDRIRFHINATPNLTGATQLLEIFPLTTSAPAVTASGWYNYIVNIPASFNGLANGYIIAQGTTSGGISSYGLGFDDFRVEAIPTCLEAGNLVASAVVTTTATLTWTASPSAPASGYEYEIRTSGAPGSGATGLALSGTTLAGVLTVNITGLVNGTTYNVYVRANCGAGDFSPWSPPVTFATSCKIPTALTVTAVSSTSANISWTAPSPASASGYEYEVRTSGAAGSGATGLFFAGTTAAGVTTASITGLTTGTSYSVYVRGNCGSGDFSNWTSASTVTPTCVRPTGVAASAITPNTATISWTASVPPTENGYEYEIRTSGAAGSGATGLFFAGTTAAGVTTANITGLTTGTTYSIYVRGNCGAFSNWTTSVTFTPTCVRPTTVVINAITPTTATISWTEPTPASASGYEYEVRTSGAAGSGATGLVASGTTLAGVPTANITGLVDATNYSVYVRGNCGSAVFSTWTTASIFTTGCKTPTLLAPTAVTTTTATITWTNTTGAPANGYEYEIRTSGAAGSGATGLFFAGTTAPGVLTANITGLSSGTAYSVYVRAACGAASFSSWTSATTLITLCNIEMAPTVVETFTNATATSPSICWTEATGVLAANSVLTVTNSEWLATTTTGFANAGSNKAIKTNLYDAGKEWLISQAIDLGTTTDFRVRYDMAVTNYNGTTLQTTMGTHKVSVVISTDGGVTWSNANVLRSYTGVGTYSNTGQSETISLAAYTGVIKIAFVATTTDSSPDIDFHIDNFVVEEIPTCADVLSPVTVTTGSSTGTFSWTASASAPANGYEYEIRTSGAPGSGATGLVASGTTLAGVLTANITGLTSNTTYSAYVRANCGPGLISPWTSASNFTTLCAPELAPTVTEGFASYTGAVPAGCWSEGTGTFGPTSTMTVGNGKWGSSTGFANAGTDKGAIINLYSTNTDWLISNQIDLGTSANFRVKYKMAVTSYNGTDAQTTLGTHKVSLVISTDGGTTWSSANTLKSYTGVGTYSNTGQIETVNVNTYTGIVKFAFVAATTSTSPDIHFHIDDFVVELIPAPTITNFASTVACGQSTALTITGTELAGATVTINGTPVTATTNTATQITATVSSALTGPIVVTTAGGTATSATNFTFAVSPALTLSGATTTICAGAPSAAITVTAGGADYTTYTWTPSTGVTGNETTGWTFNPTSTTAYTLAVSGATGCVNSAQLSVIANPLPSALTITPDNADACVNTVLALNTTGGLLQNVPIFAEDFNGTAAGWVTGNSTTGSNPAATSWTLRPEGYTVAGTSTYGPWSSNDDSQFMLTNSDAGGSGSITYTTLTSPSFSTTNYQAAKLNFYHHYRYNNTNDSSMVYYSVNNGATWTRFYLTNTANVGAYETFANADIALPAGALNQSNVKIRFVFRSAWGYTWAIDNVKVTGDLPTELTWSPATNLYTDAAATTAYVAGTNASTVYVKAATAGALTYTATATNVGTGCSVTDVANVTVHALPAAPTITAGGALAFCAGDEVVLTSSAATGNVWSNTQTTNAITVSAAGSYTVTTTDAFGCTSVASAPTVVTVNALPTVNAGADVQLCAGNAVTLTASGTALTPTWNNSVVNGVAFTPTATGTYTVTVTDANSCSGQDAVLVTVNALPTVNAGADQTVCSGTPVTLTASGTALTPTWSNGVVNGVAFTPAATTTYTVVVIDANNCTGQDAVLITVNAAPNAVATISGNVTITATPAGQTYQWVNCATNAPIAGATNATFTATANGSYKVIVTNASGCASTSSCVNITKVGIEENNVDLGIALFPNPTEGNVYVTMTATEQANITVFDAQGKVVSVMSNVQNGDIVDLNNVDKGIYVIKVSNTRGSNVFRIVKN